MEGSLPHKLAKDPFFTLLIDRISLSVPMHFFLTLDLCCRLKTRVEREKETIDHTLQ